MYVRRRVAGERLDQLVQVCGHHAKWGGGKINNGTEWDTGLMDLGKAVECWGRPVSAYQL